MDNSQLPESIATITTCPYCETQNINIEEHMKTISSEAYNCRSRECSKGLFLPNMQH